MNAPVSVITPTIPGRELKLAECISSVYKQTVPPVEHLIRASWMFSGIHHRVHISSQRNALSRAASEPWLAFLDDDDRLFPTYFEEMLPYLYMLHGPDIVYAWDAGDVDSQTGRITVGPTIPHEDISLLPVGELLDRLSHGKWALPITAVVRKDSFWHVGGWSTDFDQGRGCFASGAPGEDQDLWWKMLRAGARVKCIPKLLWSYRRGGRDTLTHMKLEDDGAPDV